MQSHPPNYRWMTDEERRDHEQWERDSQAGKNQSYEKQKPKTKQPQR